MAAALLAGDRTNTAGNSPRDWLLQSVSLGQADDQQLFELSLRLKYVEDPRVVLPALTQLHGAALADLPVEAVAARHEIVVRRAWAPAMAGRAWRPGEDRVAWGT